MDESTLNELLAEALLRVAESDTQKPRARRSRGALGRAIRAHGYVAIPPDFAAFDHLVALRPAEVTALVWLLGKAHRAASLEQSERLRSTAHRLIEDLMPLGAIDLLRGMWLLLHHAGIELDHEAIGAQLSAQHGAEIGGRYLYEATHAVASVFGGPVIMPQGDRVH